MSAKDRARDKWGLSDDPHKPPAEPAASNSRFEDSYCPPLTQIGVDTISWGWSDQGAVDRFLRLDGLVISKDDPRPLRVVPAPGGAVRLNRRLDGLGTVGAFPGACLLFVEGRARALEVKDEQDHGLGEVRQLPRIQEQVLDSVGELLGASVATPGSLRRTDLTGELRFERQEDGRDLLWVLDQMHSPNHRTSPVREKGGRGIETAYWRTPKRSIPVLRAYDKGVESGTAPPGERIRIERQVRYSGGKRPTLEQWLQRDLADMFIAPIRRWLRGGVAAGTAVELTHLLCDAGVIWPNYWSSGSSWVSSSGTVHVSLWPPRKVERVLGTLVVTSSYGAAWPPWSAKQRQRRMAEVRELGLLLTDHPVVVDVDEAVNSLCRLWAQAA